MLYAIIIVLAVLIWRQSRLITTLTRTIEALQRQVRALAAEREPLLLTEAVEELPPLLLDTPVPDAANDDAPEQARQDLVRWGYGALLGALYALFGFAFAANRQPLALSLLAISALVGAAPALRAPWRLALPQGPSIALAVAGVLQVLTWNAAPYHPQPIGPLALALLLVALGGAGVRWRWVNPTALIAIIAAIVVGAAKHLATRQAHAAIDAPVWMLALAIAAPIAARCARPNRHNRALVASAGAMGAAVLATLFVFSEAVWFTPWAPLLSFLGAAALGACAWASARAPANPRDDWSVRWWSGAASALAILGAYALAPPPLLPTALAALALGFALAFARLRWSALRAVTLAAAALAAAHTLGAPFEAMTPSWGFAMRALPGAILFAAAFTAAERDGLLRTMALAVAVFGAIRAAVLATTPDVFLQTALTADILLFAGALVIPGDGRGRMWRIAGAALALLGLTLALLSCGVRFNPWWGATPGIATGPPVLGVLGVAYLLPALLAGAAARRSTNAELARVLLVGAGALGLLWLVLEIRAAFHGAQMSAGVLATFEVPAYAALAMALGVAWQRGRERARRFFGA